MVVKGHGPELAHKSEFGAIMVNLGDDHSVRQAAEAILGLPDVDSVLVEEMVDDAVAEFIVGVTRDATLGLGLVLGMGGVLTELLCDTATLLLPVQR